MTTEPSPETGDAETDPSAEESLGTQCTVETVGPCKRRIKAEIPAETVGEKLDRNYRDLISTFQIPGFRLGRVPRWLVEKRFGGEIESEIKEKLLGLSFEEVVKQKELKVLGKPKFDNVAFQKGEPMRYEVEVEVRPEFEISTYRGVQVEPEEVPPVEPAEVDAQIDRLREEYAELVAIDPAEAKPEDIIFGHYMLRRDGVKVHTREEVRFRPGTGDLDGIEVPELKEKFAARESPSRFTIKVKLPDHYSEEVLRGSEVDLEFTVEDAKRIQLPPADDELAKRLDAQSLAELRTRIENQIEKRHRRLQEDRLEDKVLDRVAEGAQFDLPEGLLEEQVKLSRLRVELALIREGRPREEIDAALAKLDDKAASEGIRRDFKRFFILEKIAELEQIYATEDEVNTQVELLAHAYRKPFRAIAEDLEETGRMDSLRSEIRHAKVKKFLREKAAVPSPPAPPEGAEASIPPGAAGAAEQAGGGGGERSRAAATAGSTADLASGSPPEEARPASAGE